MDMAIGAVGRPGETMLAIDEARLVVLETPKTGTQAQSKAAAFGFVWLIVVNVLVYNERTPNRKARDLGELKKLLDEGKLTQGKFDQKKAKILNQRADIIHERRFVGFVS
jgi:hypothetical protein